MPKEQEQESAGSNIVCCVCTEEIADRSHSGIRCEAGHHICPDCSAGFATHTMEDLATRFKCPALEGAGKGVKCSKALVPLTFERNLSQAQVAGYLAWRSMHMAGALSKDEAVYSCPRTACQTGATGGWFCVMSKSMPRTFYDCEKCSQATCTYCKQELLEPAEGAGDAAYTAVLKSRVRHFGGGFEGSDGGGPLGGGGGGGGGGETDFCEALGPYLLSFQRVLEESEQPKCPYCGHAGRKDDACTHMNCPACSMNWCYSCGKKSEDVDGSGGRGSFGQHNTGWDTAEPAHKNRCPLFLDAIGDRTEDPAWTDVLGDAATDKFHAWLLRRNLAVWFRELGMHPAPGLPPKAGPGGAPMDLYDRLAAHFDSVRSCGVAKAEFAAFDPAATPLYKRRAQ